MIKRFFRIGLIYLSVSGFVSVLSVSAQQNLPSPKPRLVVSIVIESFRPDFLDRFWEGFGEHGFKRFIQQGTQCTNTEYPYLFCQSPTDQTTIATGAYPSRHGISTRSSYDRKTTLLTPCFFDNNSNLIGSGSGKGMVSARNMMAGTIADALQMHTYGESKVVSIALDENRAVALAGHSADAAIWLDNYSGNWVSSSYYGPILPGWVSESNTKGSAAFYMSKKWEPLLSLGNYVYNKHILRRNKPQSFSVDLSSNKPSSGPYQMLKSTPFGNNMVFEMAINAIQQTDMGKDDIPDLLMLNISGINPLLLDRGAYSMELEDLFIRIDQSLGDFVDAVDRAVGKQNVLFVVTGAQPAVNTPDDLAPYNIPSGKFDAQRVSALLNAYLMALYGQGTWVTGYFGQQFYLNHELIENSRKSLWDVQKVASEFLSEFAGVALALPSYAIRENQYVTGLKWQMQNSWFIPKSGDIMIALSPGWSESAKTGEELEGISSSSSTVPLMWYGWKIPRQHINSRVYTTAIAPTIAEILGISKPNGAVDSPIDINYR